MTTFWRKETGMNEYLEILEYLIIKQGTKLEDYFTYDYMYNPLGHMKIPILNKGWKSILAELRAKSEKNAKTHIVHEEQTVEEVYERCFINNLNYWASMNIKWHDGKDSRTRFKEARDMIYYFKKEADFE